MILLTKPLRKAFFSLAKRLYQLSCANVKRTGLFSGAQPFWMVIAQEGQAPAQAPHPVHSRAERSKGTPKGSSCSSSFFGQTTAAGQRPDPPSQSPGSHRAKSISAFLFRIRMYPRWPIPANPESGSHSRENSLLFRASLCRENPAR